MYPGKRGKRRVRRRVVSLFKGIMRARAYLLKGTSHQVADRSLLAGLREEDMAYEKMGGESKSGCEALTGQLCALFMGRHKVVPHCSGHRSFITEFGSKAGTGVKSHVITRSCFAYVLVISLFLGHQFPPAGIGFESERLTFL